MGLLQNTGRNTTFLVIKHNSICMESNVAQEGYEPVDVENPQTGEVKTKFVRKFDGVEGYVESIEWRDSEQKYKTRFRSWQVTLRDGADLFTLEFPLKEPHKFSPTFTVFAMLAGNIDFTRPLSFHAWHDKKDDRLAFGARQGGAWVHRMFTKKNPGECPFPESNELGAGSWTATNLFLRNYVMNTVIPKCKAATEARANAAPSAFTDMDDLPEDTLPKAAVAGALSEKAAAYQAQAPAGKTAPDDPFGDDFDNIPVGGPPSSAGKPEFTDDIPF